MKSEARWVRTGVPVIVLLVAAVIRLWGLPSPNELYWDEQYYVYDAEVYLGGGIGQPIPGAPAVKIADEGTWVHPPLGKWIMALLGVGPLGLRPIGWRLPSAVFGIIGVALLYLLALRLWRSVWWAGFASLLLALDGLHIVQSRIAMLDIFLSTFITAGVLFLVLDREWLDSGVKGRWPKIEAVFGSPYRLWAGASLGAATATKWTGLLALVLALTLTAIWVAAGAKRSGRSLAASMGTVVASLLAIPLLVYLLSYGAFFYQHGAALHDFATLQVRMLQYHQHHTQIQPQNSLPWTWPLLLHPIRYYGLDSRDSVVRIVAMGNPALWWGFLALLPLAGVGAIRRGGWQDAVVFGGYLALFLPWLYVGRSQFIFYLLPAVPFMCLGVTAAFQDLPVRAARNLAVGFTLIVALTAVAYLPVWEGWRIGHSWEEHLRLLGGWPI